MYRLSNWFLIVVGLVLAPTVVRAGDCRHGEGCVGRGAARRHG